MKPGESFYCPHCHSKSIVKKNPVMDGFQVVGETFVCAFCQHAIDDSATPDSTPANPQVPGRKPLDALFGKPSNSSSSKPSSPLDDLFGNSSTSSKTTSLEDLLGTTAHSGRSQDILSSLQTSPRHFCKDCRHYVVHPFECRCDITGHVVEPMDDCTSFETR